MQLHGAKTEFAKTGAKVVAVGCGKPVDVAEFRKKTGFDGPIYCDPSRATYRAAGMKAGIWKTVGPSAWAAASIAKKRGSRQTKTQGAVWQQGGALVVASPDKLLLHHVNQHSGDNVAPEVILSALRSQ